MATTFETFDSCGEALQATIPGLVIRLDRGYPSIWHREDPYTDLPKNNKNNLKYHNAKAEAEGETYQEQNHRRNWECVNTISKNNNALPLLDVAQG
jgi:hypothetical protein